MAAIVSSGTDRHKPGRLKVERPSAHCFLHNRAAASTARAPRSRGDRATPDAPDIFLSNQKLAAIWGAGNRKWIFAEDPDRDRVEQVFAGRLYSVQTIADKTLWNDRPL
jgi:hypothetical protein